METPAIRMGEIQRSRLATTLALRSPMTNLAPRICVATRRSETACQHVFRHERLRRIIAS